MAMRGQTQRIKQGQGQQQRSEQSHGQSQAQTGHGGPGQDSSQGQGLGNATRSLHDAAWYFDEFAQQNTLTPGSTQNQGINTGIGVTQTPRPQGNVSVGLRRGLGNFANSSTQRGHAAMPPPHASNSHFHHNYLGNHNNVKTNHYGTQVQQSMSMHAQEANASAVSQQQPSMGFSQAYALGVSIPTSKFNTEAFGTLSVRPDFNTTSNTGGNTITATGVAYDPESLDDDLELPVDIDDDFEMMDSNAEKDMQTLDAEVGMDNVRQSFGGNHAQASQMRIERAEEASAIDEAALLKLRLAEVEAQLKQKQEELQIESGRSSILKDKLEDVSKSNTELNEKLRSTNIQHQAEKEAMKEKHQKDLANTNMNHQFEMQKYILDGPSAAKGIKASQQARPPPQPPTPTFPKSFAGFASTQSSISMPRSDEGFSIHNFAVTPKSPRKSRSFGVAQPSEKPRSFQTVIEPAKLARPVFGLSSDIPTQSDEEIIRDKLLSRAQRTYGLRQLLTIEADEDQSCPMPRSQEHMKNMELEQSTANCVNALANLMQSADSHSKQVAFKSSADLLRSSIIMRKPYHTVNALHIVAILCFTYEDLLAELSRGAVPFLDDERQDPLVVVPSDKSIPSALAGIHHLFLTRIAMPLPSSAPPPFPTMRQEHRLSKEAEEIMYTDIFQMVDLLARYQLETKTLSRCFLPLVRRRVYGNLLNLHLQQCRFDTLGRVLDILDVITRDVECARLLVGWSISQGAWTEAFSQIEVLSDFIGIKTDKILDMANGVLPRIIIKVFEILERITHINFEQTKTIVYKTSLIKRIIYSIRSLVELAGEIRYRRTLGSVWQKADSQLSSMSGNAAVRTHSSSSISSTLAMLPKPESYSPGAGGSNQMNHFLPPKTMPFQQQISVNGQHRANSILDEGPMPPSGLTSTSGATSAVEAHFSLFQENICDAVRYKSLSLQETSIHGGLGSRQVSVLMSPHNKVFDFVVLLKQEMEFILNIIRAIPDYPQYLSEKEPTEYRALAYAVSRIAVGELGLSAQSQGTKANYTRPYMSYDKIPSCKRAIAF
ncbi:hypothetical protein EDD11_002084 [Mortierella claussenii]|nr:hypothetical protein EDD11_002084 [Mortierella claussenii]